MLCTLSGYGTFPIWHKDADLYMIDLKSESVPIRKRSTAMIRKVTIRGRPTEDGLCSAAGVWMDCTRVPSLRMSGRMAKPVNRFAPSKGGGLLCRLDEIV